MASLQKIKGRGKDEGKTFFRIQPYINGKRVTIRFGSGQKKAEASAKAIGDLIDSKKAGSKEFYASTKAWLESAADRAICEQLLKYELIEELPKRFLESDANSRVTTISMLATEYINTRGAGQSAATIEIYQKAKRNLIDCFGDVDVTTIQPKNAREFWRWLIEEGNSLVKKGENMGLGTNTAKQRLRYARAFFEQAVEDELLRKNPFNAKGLKTTQTAAEKDYIPLSTIEKVIEFCPTTEWKLLFALIRTVPIRMPSEIKELTWSDVDWEANKILIHSPKTRAIGQSARLVPIFPLLKIWLEKAFGDAEEGELYVFPSLRLNSNLSTTAKKIVLRAKVEPWIGKTWGNFFNSLRASTETDLMDEHGLRRACQWAGNSAATAMKNYALVRKSDFQDIGTAGKSDAKCAAIDASDAKCAAESASMAEQKTHKKSTVENQRDSTVL